MVTRAFGMSGGKQGEEGRASHSWGEPPASSTTSRWGKCCFPPKTLSNLGSLFLLMTRGAGQGEVATACAFLE